MPTFVRSEDDDDDESGASPTARSATVPDRRPPSADRMEFATPCTPEGQRTLAGRCSANGLRNPGNRRRKKTLAEESSESEAEAISERHSKWVTFGNPCVLSRAPVTISLEDEQGGRDCGFEQSGSLKDTTACLGLADSGARGGSEPDQLSEERSERLLDISGLIEATSAQLERAGNSQSCWTPLHLGKGQPRQAPLEEKMAAWDPCQEDSFALSPPGELELFELDTLYPRRPTLPAAATRRIQACSSPRSSSRMSTPRVSPQRFKKPLPARPPAANLYEDLRWIVESSEKSAGPPLRAECVTASDVETMSAQPQVSIGPTPAASAEWQSKELFAATGKMSSVVQRATSPSSSRPTNEVHQDYGQLRSGAGWSTVLQLVGEDSNHTPAVASSVKVAPDPVRPGIQKDEAKEGVTRSSEPVEQEPAAREENHQRHRRYMRRKEAFEAQEERAGFLRALCAQRGDCVFNGPPAQRPVRRGHFSLSVGL